MTGFSTPTSRGLLFTVQKASPLLSPGASIILNASVAGAKGFAGGSVYSASKAAVRSFARGWMLDLKGTRRARQRHQSWPDPDTDHGQRLRRCGKGQGFDRADRRGCPRSAGSASPRKSRRRRLFLASSEGSFVNGAELFVDGGLVQV